MQMKLENLADVIIPKPLKKTDAGENVTIVTPKVFSKSGYTTNSPLTLNFELPISANNQLSQYDIVLSKTAPFKVAIMGKLNQDMYVVHNSLFIIRTKNAEVRQHSAIALYMYLKSNHGQNALLNLSKVKTTNLLSRKDLFNLDIPDYQGNLTEIINNFEQEQSIQNEINASQLKIQKIHEFFGSEKDTNTLGICQMCKKNQASHLRTDTWQPFKKGIPMCDECSQNIMH